MPYIKKTDRESIVCDLDPKNPGELNFLFTWFITEYLETKGTSYSTYNEIIGALECCKLELYRRMVAPYEDKKIEENGDVY